MEMGTSMLRILALLLALCSTPGDVCGGYLTPAAWEATTTTLVDGRLRYYKTDLPVAPGVKESARVAKDLLVGSAEDLRDTVVKAPETLKAIYDTGLVGNILEYQGMVSANWKYAKLAGGDFSDAGEAYIREGNWGLMQTAYYGLKGTSRVVWAVAILNSGEAMYQVGKAATQTVYYLLRYPVSGVLQGAAAPVVAVGGAAWSVGAAGVTTGWALPVTTTIDAAQYAGEAVWSGK